jgi:hypothetical protein
MVVVSAPLERRRDKIGLLVVVPSARRVVNVFSLEAGPDCEGACGVLKT